MRIRERLDHWRRSTGVAAFDVTDPEEMADALLDVAARVVRLERIAALSALVVLALLGIVLAALWGNP